MNKRLTRISSFVIILVSFAILIGSILIFSNEANEGNSDSEIVTSTAASSTPSQSSQVSNGKPWFTGKENVQSCTINDSKCIDVQALSNGDEIITVFYNGTNGFYQTRCTNDDIGPYCIGTLKDGTLIKIRNYP